jgi:hypothetical protein
MDLNWKRAITTKGEFLYKTRVIKQEVFETC